MDPSHLPYAHHGILGNRNRPRTKIDSVNVDAQPTGFVYTRSLTMRDKPVTFSLSYAAPVSVRYYMQQERPNLALMVTPTRPGWSRLFITQPTDFSQLPLWVRLVLQLRNASVALRHAMDTNAVLDGDTYTLHLGERALPLSVGIGDAYIRSCYMPAPDDSPVIAWRRWLGRHGGGALPTCSPADAAAMPPAMAKRDALDRGGQHLVHCKHCQGAVKQVDAASAVAAAVGVVALFTAVAKAVAVTAAPAAAATSCTVMPTALAAALQSVLAQPGLVQAAGVALVAAAVLAGLQHFRAKFFYEDYVHAFRDGRMVTKS